MKVKNKTLAGLIAFLPLIIVETFILAFEYFDPGNTRANINLCLIFGFVSLMIIGGKFFFDFIVTLIVNKSTKASIGTDDTVHTLISMMPLQWATLILPVIAMILGVGATSLLISALIALANIVYYVAIGTALYRITEKKAYIITYAVMSIITLVSAFVTI